MNVENKKIAFLTFTIVEESIKRACLKVETDKLMPVNSDTLKNIKKALNDSRAFKHMNKGQLVLPRIGSPGRSHSNEIVKSPTSKLFNMSPTGTTNLEIRVSSRQS